jgi:hypothetical protein
MRRVILLRSVGWAPPLTCCRRMPASLLVRVSWTRLSTPPRVTPHQGDVSSAARGHTLSG